MAARPGGSIRAGGLQECKPRLPPTAMWPFPGTGSGPALLTVAEVTAGTTSPSPRPPLHSTSALTLTLETGSSDLI